ncbi:DNA recombination protein RmuC [Catenovulum sediminis]|uniref:DNA recombination protein RmuC n=1 Tax=Catenovulum sediminis TaxID=1740262 RepID=UPI001FEC747D|nr:DNA recombination protein RmuC [Catenovulum sediminis]
MSDIHYYLLTFAVVLLTSLLGVFRLLHKIIDRTNKNQQDADKIQAALTDLRISLMNQQHESFASLEHRQNQQFNQLLSQIQKNEQNSAEARINLLDKLNRQHAEHRQELSSAVNKHGETVSKRLSELSALTESRLDKMSQRMNDKLAEGFENTVKTFSDILQRLALIDEAQKKINELSGNVVSLQNVLTDKRSRGAFGEVQLYSLIENVMAVDQFKKQARLSNGRIADCQLLLPKPTGNIVIDAKFPLESFRKLTAESISDSEKKLIERQFKQDIKKHIVDIANRYICPPETAESAILFLPAEAIFAEIHAYHADVVEFAWQNKVWLTSPSTLMAILTTAKAVLKDEATKAHIHTIQKHLVHLGEDFARFQGRFDQLSRHIDQAANDVKQIHTSASKISNRFKSIEQVRLQENLSQFENSSSQLDP